MLETRSMLSSAPPVIFDVQARNIHQTWWPDVVLAEETFSKVGESFDWESSLDYGRVTGVTTLSGQGDLAISVDDGQFDYHAHSQLRVVHEDGQTFFGDFDDQEAFFAAYVLGPVGTPYTVNLQLDVDKVFEGPQSSGGNFGISNQNRYYGGEVSDNWTEVGFSWGPEITYAGNTYSAVSYSGYTSRVARLRLEAAASGGYSAFTTFVEMDVKMTMSVHRDLPDIAVKEVSLSADGVYQVGYSLDVGRQQAIAPVFTAYWSSTDDKLGVIGEPIAIWEGPLTHGNRI